MKKLLILILLILGVNIVYGQHSALDNKGKTYHTEYISTIIDSTLHNIDTIFIVKNNIVYRTIETVFQEDSKEKEWRLIKYTTTFDGKQWNWNNTSIEKYYTFTGLSTTITMGGPYHIDYKTIGGTEMIDKPKKKKK